MNKINEHKFYINKKLQVLLQAMLQPMREEAQIRAGAFQHPKDP